MGKETDGRPLWTARVREFVEGQQERAYRRLADDLGLDGDARRAYARLAKPVPPASRMAQRSRDDLEAYRPLPEGLGLDAFNTTAMRLYERYRLRPPPTPYEDPTRYPLLEMLADALWDELGAVDRQPDVRPIVATMPTGDVNARILGVPGADRPVVFVEQGLFAFLHTMAVVVAWVTPPIRLDDLSDARLAMLPGRHTIPFQAPHLFGTALKAYAIEGSLEGLGPIPKPEGNVGMAMALFAQMQRFALAHEFAHFRLGHFGRQAATWQESFEREHEADLDAAHAVAAIARRACNAWAMGVWGSELTLLAFNLLDRALAILEFGPQRLAWTSRTHPQPVERRKRLHDTMPDGGTALGRAAAEGLYRMDEAIFQRLWDMVHLDFVLLHKQGVRPSPIWRERLRRSLRPKEAPPSEPGSQTDGR